MNRKSGPTRRVIAGLIGVIALVRLNRLAYRSGATDAEVSASLPGDALLPRANHTVDRAVDLPAPAADVWPWLVQLGSKRAGWYFSRRLGVLLPERGRGLRRIEPEFQQLQVGDLIPDYGPGNPGFRVEIIDPPHALVYLSLRDRSRNYEFPLDNQDRPGLTALSWALILTDHGDTSRLHIRLKMPLGRFGVITGFVAGLIDWLTISWLFGGLPERVRRQSSHHIG